MDKLCNTCLDIFRGIRVIGEEQPHHFDLVELQKAAGQGCYICRTISEDINKSFTADQIISFTSYLAEPLGLPDGWLKLTIESDDGHRYDVTQDQESSDTDESSVVTDVDQVGTGIWGFLLYTETELPQPTYMAPNSLDSDELFELATRWHKKCEQHAKCNMYRGKGFMPRRLLDLEDAAANGQIKLYLTKDGIHEPYATLSHCWGKSMNLKLLSSNIDKFKDCIQLSELPLCYREAITVAQRFHLRYLWIDSLCIMQDSKADWLSEASKMADIYRGSELSIAAAGAAESSEPWFASRNAEYIAPVKVDTKWRDTAPSTYLIFDESIRAELDFSPLRQRAWVVQEVYLAPKVLNFGRRQMWWECCEFEACETWPDGIPPALMSDRRSLGTVGSYGAYGQGRFESLVEAYSSCALTYDTDRVIAFAGIAKHFEELLNDTYVAGMLKSTILRELLWRKAGIDQAYRSREWRAPSWSWLSVEGGVIFRYASGLAIENSDYQFLYDITSVEASADKSPSDHYLIFQETALHLRGYVQDIEFRPSKEACESIRLDDGDSGRDDTNDVHVPNSGYAKDILPLSFWWDDDEEDLGNHMSFIIGTEYMVDNQPTLVCLMLKAIDKPDQKLRAFRRVGLFEVCGAELMDSFKPRSHSDILIY